MRLELLTFIDEIMVYYHAMRPAYEEAEKELLSACEQASQHPEEIVAFRTRIKNDDSLKEKLLRNRLYEGKETPEEVLAIVPDLIGITLECRFISHEAEIYKLMFHFFRPMEDGMYQCTLNDNIYMNLSMPQPQLQRNGFPIYRIDGKYMKDGMVFNFEFQIKSLVHTFWSEIEHEVVYKNPDNVVYNSFNQNMLGAIRDNLDIVDHQLEIMYNQISYESVRQKNGFDEVGFKTMITSSLNSFVNRKMRESFGFTTDFKKSCATIAQYIYVRYFMNGEHNELEMTNLLNRLSDITQSDIDFSEEVYLEKPYESDDPFCRTLGSYFTERLNSSFQWHIFFVTLFAVNPENNLEDFADFISFLRQIVIQPNVFAQTFAGLSEAKRCDLQYAMEETVAQGMVDADSISIVHEDKLIDLMNAFAREGQHWNDSILTDEDAENRKENCLQAVLESVDKIFCP